MTSKLLPFALALLFAGGPVLAQPSGGFHLYRSTISGKQVCSQNPISPDWVKQAGPYQDPVCKVEQKQAPARTDLPASPLDLAPKPQR
ncbi:hypothetical protein [Variovorax sp. DAIF25]|jgi:hypothetical protein|uniref:hypothetical protein n=1 Tax=Variovorax sp. DAIF25 TaxID=3080983 RepID=UPI003D6A6CA7